jgi:rhodanese-related sulfurtransferase
MPVEINSPRVQELVDHGANLLEVLPEKEYEEEHLPRAINIPLKHLNRAATSSLRRDTPIVTYCYDAE